MAVKASRGRDSLRKNPLSIRARMVITFISLSALALIITEMIAFSLATAVVTQRVNGSLERAAVEFETLAQEGINLATGAPLENAHDLLYVALKRRTLADSEGVLGIVNSKITLKASGAVQLRLENDPEFCAHLESLAANPQVRFGTFTTDKGAYRYVSAGFVVPQTGEVGSFVRATNMRAELALINENLSIFVAISLGSLGAIGVASWFVSGRLLKPLALVRETAKNITETDLSRRIPQHGNDDLAAVIETVNAMLDRLENSMIYHKQLLDDIGHELKTPLTIIRGHLELMDPLDNVDSASTRALVMDEVDRMSRLVGELLSLARAEQPDFLFLSPCRLGQLTDEVLDKMRGLGERNWRLDALADVTVSLDSQRITQGWLQLAKNAVQYSAPGSEISVGSEIDQGYIRLWVKDSGSGMSGAQLDVLKEYLFNPEGTRLRIKGGRGLGLPIVNAIVRAHRGRLEVTSALGVGSTFAMVLPLGERVPDADLGC